MRRGVMTGFVVAGVAAMLSLSGPAAAADRAGLAKGGGDAMIPFAESPVPPAPTYASPSAWAALPDRQDAADVHPPGTAMADQSRAPVDVFFVHPTSYFGREAWNAAMEDGAVNERTDDRSIRNQASVFNGCCRVFAPRYRQATFAGFLTRAGSDAEKALALAYGDVRAAFAHYLATWNDGRPFILASHSQGSRYALWLLQDEIEGTPLQERLVAAYIVGYAIPADWFTRNLTSIRLCGSASETGCVLTWSTYGEGAEAERSRFDITHRYAEGFEPNRGKPLVCTNPLSWSAGQEPASASLHRGLWFYPRRGAPKPPQPGVTGARCENGALFVETLEGIRRRVALPGENYHTLDYQLFYMDIRENAQRRTEAFLNGHDG